MTIVHTTYDANVNPVRCCAHVEKSLSDHQHIFGNANEAFKYEGQNYFFLYDKTKPSNKVCCVYYAKRIVNGSGTLVWVADTSRQVLFCGDRINI